MRCIINSISKYSIFLSLFVLIACSSNVHEDKNKTIINKEQVISENIDSLSTSYSLENNANEFSLDSIIDDIYTANSYCKIDTLFNNEEFIHIAAYSVSEYNELPGINMETIYSISKLTADITSTQLVQVYNYFDEDGLYYNPQNDNYVISGLQFVKVVETNNGTDSVIVEDATYSIHLKNNMIVLVNMLEPVEPLFKTFDVTIFEADSFNVVITVYVPVANSLPYVDEVEKRDIAGNVLEHKSVFCNVSSKDLDIEYYKGLDKCKLKGFKVLETLSNVDGDDSLVTKPVEFIISLNENNEIIIE